MITLREELKNSDVVNCKAISYILGLDIETLRFVHWDLISIITNVPFYLIDKNSVHAWKSFL